MNDNASRKSSRRSVKSNSDEVESSPKENWKKHKFSCNWNFTCKALIVGLILMFIGGSMATIGYFVDHIYTSTEAVGNDTITTREKNRLTINSISTYVGPMIMGVGGFIVVAACVMTFEQRDSAAKVIPNRLQLNMAHTHSINRHNKPSPSSRFPIREGSVRRHNVGTNFMNEPLEEFSRRELTANFIQFSRNLQQANIEKSLAHQIMGKSPSAPNLAGTDLFNSSKTSPKHTRHSRNSLHPLIGQSLLTPHVLHRQALSVDSPEYYPHTVSPPRSKGASRQSSYSTGRGSAESIEAEIIKRPHSSQASMMLDLHMPNDCPISLRIRDRNIRSDTARRHLLKRQVAQIDSEEDSIEKDSRCSSPQLIHKLLKEEKYYSSIPHSCREFYFPRILSIEDPLYQQHAYRYNENLMRNLSPTSKNKRSNYHRSNTVSNEPSCRRSSSTFDPNYRKGSADYNYRSRRKSSNTSDSSRYCSKSNIDDLRYRKGSKSPTSSLKSFQELRYISQKLSEQEHIKQVNCKRKQSCSGVQYSGARFKVQSKNQSLSPDSVSVSSSTTEGHSKTDFTSIEIESTEEDFVKKV